jgi:hypothetical protein
MANFIVVDNTKVVNYIVADSKENAENVTGLICIEHTPEINFNIGWDYIDGVFSEPTID